jgi:hypothetical protein
MRLVRFELYALLHLLVRSEEGWIAHRKIDLEGRVIQQRE